MKKIHDFILQHKLKPGDAVEMICPIARFPKHYTVFMGVNRNNPEFIANMTSGIQLVKGEELNRFLLKYEVTHIERFNGNDNERKRAIKKALSRLGEKAYSFVFNNCEHFKNWVLYGESKSKQVTAISSGIALSGIGLFVAGIIVNKKGMQRAGLVIIITLAIFLLIAFWILKNKADNQD